MHHRTHASAYTPDMRLLLATSNPHKIEEVGAILASVALPEPIMLLSLRDLGLDGLDEPVEDATTFEGNAAIKACYYAQAAARAGHAVACIADDSGLEVDALDGEPGVRSARYAGHDGPRAQRDLANNRRVLERLASTPPARRTARFVCVIAVAEGRTEVEAESGAGSGLASAAACGADAGGVRVRATFRGTVQGRIITPDQADDPAQPERGRGMHGFGYDPLFVPDCLVGPEAGLTSAQIPPDRKNAISHRANATRALANWLAG